MILHDNTLGSIANCYSIIHVHADAPVVSGARAIVRPLHIYSDPHQAGAGPTERSLSNRGGGEARDTHAAEAGGGEEFEMCMDIGGARVRVGLIYSEDGRFECCVMYMCCGATRSRLHVPYPLNLQLARPGLLWTGDGGHGGS